MSQKRNVQLVMTSSLRVLCTIGLVSTRCVYAEIPDVADLIQDLWDEFPSLQDIQVGLLARCHGSLAGKLLIRDLFVSPRPDSVQHGTRASMFEYDKPQGKRVGSGPLGGSIEIEMSVDVLQFVCWRLNQ
ncbi:hypothetical protein GE09DRAFT_1123281, partial [Coniochaeta sp. 2T2.1]